MRFLFWPKLAIGVFLTIMLIACVTTPAVKITPEQAVMARAQQRWDALLAGQLEKSYEYITPAGRSTLPLSIYRSRLAAASWNGAKVTGAVCEPEVCEVTILLDINVLPNLPHQQPVSEKWLMDGGKWWFVYRG